jgi:hypothetical protein
MASEKTGYNPEMEPRILIFSQRNIFKPFHYRCYIAEFEDLICKIDDVEYLAPYPKKWFDYGTRIAQRITTDFSVGFNPGIPKITLKKEYDIFFAFCQFPKDLLHVECIVDWDKKCRTSVCWLSEMWLSEFQKYRYYIKILSKFDHVILHWSQSVQPLNKLIGDKAIFSPLGIDSILFNPYPDPPIRFIDVYSIGRRSEETHKSILKMSEKNRYFYVYDTIKGEQVSNSYQHRSLFANMAKRSRYFIVNPGKKDVPGETQGQSETGNRYYEGLAAGTILLGERPQNDEFEKTFYWPDAVLQLPFGSENVAEIIEEYDTHRHTHDDLRRKNVLESITKHDWAYRWEYILGLGGLTPGPGLRKRKEDLSRLAKTIEYGTN